MKTEINLYNKKIFFGQYYGQNIYKEHNKPTIDDYVDLIEEVNKQSYLHLKSLLSITNNDAIEVGKILQVYPEDVPDWINGDCTHEDFNGPYTFQYAIDYLRSKGYALPWMGLSVQSMIEAGWIKLTESLQNKS